MTRDPFWDDVHGLGDWRLDDPDPPTSGGGVGNAYARKLQAHRTQYATKFELVVRLAVKVMGWHTVNTIINRVRADATLAGR